jgi:hypothetical protein
MQKDITIGNKSSEWYVRKAWKMYESLNKTELWFAHMRNMKQKADEIFETLRLQKALIGRQTEEQETYQKTVLILKPEETEENKEGVAELFKEDDHKRFCNCTPKKDVLEKIDILFKERGRTRSQIRRVYYTQVYLKSW